MRRWCLAVAAVIGPLAGLVSADYVIIKVDLNKFLAEGEGKKDGTPGFGMPGGYPGMPGGAPGGYPGGMMPGRMGGGMLGGGMPGRMGGGMPGGMPGMPGGMPGMPGGMPGGPGGGGTSGSGFPGRGGMGMIGMPGGAPGMPGGPGGRGGFPGMPGGMPGMPGGMPGMMPGMPGMAGGPGGEADEDKEEYHPLWAYAYLELKKPAAKSYDRQGKVLYYQIEHKWGKPVIVPNEAVTAYVRESPLLRRFDDRLRAITKEGKTPERLLLLAEWALERGLLTQFNKLIADVKAMAPGNATVRAVEKAAAALKARPGQDDPAAASLTRDLAEEGYRPVQSEAGHYTLLTNVKNAQGDPSVKRRLDQMEETYQTFYYWFAMKGSPRPVPNYRLVAVLVRETESNSTKEFESKHVLFDQVPMVADGFTARRDNVVILSTRRTDEAFNTLVRNNTQLWTEHRLKGHDLLNDPKMLQRRGKDVGATKIPVLQTLALLQEAMQEESEHATVTHECVRQLEAASGLIPRNVNAAEWAQFGLAAFFETPHHAFYPVHGAANWNHLVNFKYHRRPKVGKLGNKKPLDILLSVISDRYFQTAYRGLREQGEVSTEKDKEAQANRVADQLEIARCTAWALTYYLMTNHQDKLLAYYGELRKLPRDVEYDAGVLKTAFGRAFGMLAADPADPRKQTLDLKAAAGLAEAWMRNMHSVQLDVVDIEQREVSTREKAAQQDKSNKTGSGSTQPAAGAPPGRPGFGGPGGAPFGRPGGGAGNTPFNPAGGFRPGGNFRPGSGNRPGGG